MRPAAFVDFRCISLDPAPDTTGVHLDAAFGHQQGHVFISQGVWEVPTDVLHDHLTGKMAAFEGIGGRDRHAPPRYQTPPPNFATEPISLSLVLVAKVALHRHVLLLLVRSLQHDPVVKLIACGLRTGPYGQRSHPDRHT